MCVCVCIIIYVHIYIYIYATQTLRILFLNAILYIFIIAANIKTFTRKYMLMYIALSCIYKYVH